MTYDGTDPDDDGVVEGDVDNESVNTEKASITNETYVEVVRGTGISIASATWVNLDASQQRDTRNEYDENGNAQFIPDETGHYRITIKAEFAVGSSGDLLLIRFRNVTDGTTVDGGREDMRAPTTNNEVHTVEVTTELTAGKAYEIQIRNNSSSDTVGGDRAKTQSTIERVILE